MYSLGIDIGTQSLKVIVANELRVLGSAQQSISLVYPRPSWAEQDPQEWEQVLGPTIAQALLDAGCHADAIDSIGIAGQLDGCIAVGSNCEPLSPCIVWMDRRATEEIARLSESQRGVVAAKTGVVPDASHLAAKIAWLKGQGLPEGTRFHQPTSFLVERLCGAFVTDTALASTSMLYSLSDKDYDDELLELFSIERDELARVAQAHSLAGALNERGAQLTGLPIGIPLAVGTGDDFATLLGAGVTKPGPMLCALGTAEVVGALSSQPLVDRESLVETHPFMQHYYVQNPGWLSGGALRWLRTILMIESDNELDRLAQNAPIGCDGLSFIPALSGAMAPSWEPDARGCFYGLSAGHTREHMARAILEGCAFAMRDVRDRLDSMGLGQECIVLLGGGARSELWARMRADLCQVDVYASCHDESCALGAAFLAMAAHRACSPAIISQGWQAQRKHYAPNTDNRVAYQDAYDRYRKLFASLAPMWE